MTSAQTQRQGADDLSYLRMDPRNPPADRCKNHPPSDGANVSAPPGNTAVICFTDDTLILTNRGQRPIQQLRPGDQVVTRDNSVQPIRWLGSQRVDGRAELAPICIGTGVFGNDAPLCVSPQHRMVYAGADASLLFAQPEVMVPAKHLVDGRKVVISPRNKVTYYHMLFDRHEVVFANGAASESFHPGPVGLNSINDAAREELFGLFPTLRSDPAQYGDTARMVLRHYEAQALRLDVSAQGA